ncbi:MAG TPA: MlaD family protein [Candidatus Binataceae bacterium]|nr:MlaD family protein [Candidatus Binataceae bacterium]
MPDERTPLSAPESKVVARKRRRISLVWLVPIISAVIGAWVAVTRIMSEGPKLSIMFHSAEGLEAGKTKIRYKGVEVGTITSLRLSEDHRRVIAQAQMAPKTEDFLVQDTQFWAVRPRISGANVTGLGTLISGAFIAMQIGESKEPKRNFIALETPPVVTSDEPGRFFILRTADLGSLDYGTPVFFRHLQVGEVGSYDLGKDGQTFELKIFVKAPYDQYVNPATRFWRASGIDMQLTANGLKVQTESLLSVLIGGIAFETSPSGPVLPPAEADSMFTLFGSRMEAFEPPPRNPQTYELVFNESVRGLSPGAPVELRGINVGEVSEIRAEVDARTLKFSTPVTIKLDAQRLGVKIVEGHAGMNIEEMRRKFIDALVANGVRAQLRTGNLLTGAIYVAFDFFPDAPRTKVDWSQNPARLPTIPGEVEATEKRVGDIVKKFDELPLVQIANNLQKVLGDLDLTLVSARDTINNANTVLEPNSVQREKFDKTLNEVGRAARSVRVLADYLERHPEALLRGKKEESK